MSKPRNFTEQERGEICAEYRQAKYKEDQVGILAELHATSTAEIRGILYAGGVYQIGPEEIREAAERILGGVTFGSLRNHKKAFSGIDAKEAKKIFKDFVYIPWGSDLAEDPRLEEAKKAAAAALDAAKKPGPQPKEQKTGTVKPPLADPAREFSEEEVRLLVNGLLNVKAENLALQTQMQHEIDEKHRQAAELLEAAEKRMDDLREVEARIAQGNELLQRLRDLYAEEAAARE